VKFAHATVPLRLMVWLYANPVALLWNVAFQSCAESETLNANWETVFIVVLLIQKSCIVGPEIDCVSSTPAFELVNFASA